MKRTILGMAEAGEPLLQQALQAVRAHQRLWMKGDQPRRSQGSVLRLITCIKPSSTTSCTRPARLGSQSTDRPPKWLKLADPCDRMIT